MAEVKPFKAIRYDLQKAGRPEDLFCPPYDIIPDSGEWLRKSRYNIVRLEKPESEHPYRDAAETLKKWREEGILKQDSVESFYIYEEEFESFGKKYKVAGILGHVRLTAFSDGVVLPHENTLSKAKADRYELMTATRCHFSPIYSLYQDDNSEITPIVNSMLTQRPEIECTMPDGIIHRLWRIDDKDECLKISKAFESKPLFIADGHHRYETSLKISQESGASPYVLMMLTELNHPGLVVYPTHRILSGLEHFDTEETLKALEDEFTIEKGSAPAVNTAVFITPLGNYRLIFKDKSFTGLDVSLLHDHILQPHFGITPANMASQKNLTYTRDPNEAIEAVKSGKAQCAFLINPTKVSQIRDVALAGGKLPQKSTYFYPKLITGLVINDFSV